MLRVEKLLQALTPSERKTLDAKLLLTRSGELRRLYETIAEFEKSGRSLKKEKKEVFLRVFEEPYSAAKDYRLRNAYRELGERIKDVLLEKESAETLASNPHERDLALLRALYRRKLWTEFDAACRKALNDAVAACEFFIAHQLGDLYADYLLTRNELDVSIMPEVKKVLQKSQEHLKQAYLSHAAYLQSKHIAMCEHAMMLSNLCFEPTPPEPDVTFEHLTNPIAEYQVARSRAFKEGGRGDVRWAEVALRSIMRVKAKSKYRCFMQAAAMNNLAIAYMLNGKHKEACHYAERSIAHLSKHALPIDARFVINHLEALLKQRAFKKALSVIATYRETLEENEQTRFRAQCLECYSHLFLREPSEARKVIPKEIRQHDEEQYHLMRYAQIIVPYLRGHLEDALREAQNFAKRFHKKRSRVALARDKSLIGLYVRWLKLRLDAPFAKPRTLLQELLSEISALGQQQGFYVDYLPLLWLKDDIERVAGLKDQAA